VLTLSVLAVTQAEDPEKLLDQVVNEMQEDLIKMRQASAQVRYACRRHCQGGFVALLLLACGDPISMPNRVHAHAIRDFPVSSHPHLCLLFLLQVMASQKQMEAKYKQAQITAVSDMMCASPAAPI
jgi:hypothetical protein